MRLAFLGPTLRALPLVAPLCLLPGTAALAQNERAGPAIPEPGDGTIRITRPGAYVLHRDIRLRAPRVAIEITASNVTLDLNGHALLGPGGQRGVGVRVARASGVHVHGGNVARFGMGVEVHDAVNVRISGLQIQGEDGGGPPPGEVGVMIFNSRAVVVEKNVITGTFLGVFVRGGASSGNRIADNTITGGVNGQLGVCYNPDGLGTPAGPRGDRVYSNLISRFQTGIQTSAGSAGNIFRQNDIAFVAQGTQEVTPGSNIFEDNAQIAITLP
jgi:nitrous oxidase accessory protein NosD